MSTELFLCVSQDIAKHPYKFNLTNIKVYSFEEVLYHTYHYWQNSFDDIFSQEFILWVSEELGLNILSNRIKEISYNKSFSQKMLSFLSMIEYFDSIQLKKIRHELIQWEAAMEWQRLKQRADYLVKNNNPKAAVNIYKKALNSVEDVQILNNLGIALLKIEDYSAAEFYLNKAFQLDNDNFQILLNLTEAAIHNNNFELAVNLLDMINKKDKHSSFLYYLYGELNFVSDNPKAAIEYYKKAHNISKDNFYLYCLSDLYVSLREYSNALKTLKSITEPDKITFIKLSEVYLKSDNVSKAIKCIKEGMKIYNDNCELITILARCYRLDCNLEESLMIINIALKLEPDNKNVNLEYANIKKAMGFFKEYQIVLSKILMSLKSDYSEREQVNVK